MKTSFAKIWITALLLAGFLPGAIGQLQWSSFNKNGGLVTNDVATGGDSTYGGNVSFIIPPTTELIFMTKTFQPTNIGVAGSATKVNFNMTSTGGLSPGNTGRVMGMGLFNDPGTPTNALDDSGYWTDLNTGNTPPSFEMFYRTSTVTTFFQYDSAHKLGSGKISLGTPSNNVPYGMQFQLNNPSGTGISMGTSSSTYAASGAAITNGNNSVDVQSYSSATTFVTLPTTNFNELAFMYDNLSGIAVTVTLSSITFVPANPIIQSQPVGYSGSPGDTTPASSFSVALNANSGTPVGYQWYEATATVTNTLVDGTTVNGSVITGSTSNILSFANAQPADSGTYFVVVTNAYGSATSAPAFLNIFATATAPTIYSIAPRTATIVSGQGTNVTVTAAGAPSPVYYWYDAGSNLLQTGASPTLSLSNVQQGGAGVYTVVASNYLGAVETNFDITVIVTPVISSQPTNLLLNAGESATFLVTASGVPAPTYQWYKNNQLIPGATNTNYTIASVGLGDIGTYDVVVSNSAGATTSSGAILALYSSMTAGPTSPLNNASSVCDDTLLTLGFNEPVLVGNTGTIRVYNTANPSTPVDSLDLSGGNLQPRTVGGISLNSYDILVNSNTATIYPHAGVLSLGQTYYVTVDPGVFVDTNGAYFAGVTNSTTWQFTTRSTGPSVATNLVVAADGSGDFCTVQGAIDFVPAANTTPTVIHVQNGVYTEINRVNSKNNITFIGQNRAQTIINYPNNNNINPSTTTRPMFGVMSANDIALENLTLTNSTPHGGSQAEALLVNYAKRFMLLNANLCSYQDTLLVNQSGDQAYIQDSHIQGDTDYIWGSGTLFATNDELMAMSTQSYLTQARTLQYTNGFAFVDCLIDRANSSVSNGTLGRDAGASGSTPYYPYGQAAYVDCTMDTNLIIPAGWALGSGTTQGADTASLRFWEYGSVDLNGNPVNTSSRVAWSTQISASTATNLVGNATNWLYGWQPELAPLILTNPVGSSVAGGAPATLSVAASAIGTTTFQWYQNGSPLSGATNSTLFFAQAYAGQAGTYFVQVSNVAGVATSSSATLNVGSTAPVFTPLADLHVNAGVTLNVTNQVIDPDVPPKTLSFALVSGPVGATLNPATGVFVWRASVSASGSTNPVVITVSDNGSPSLTATQTFNVIVNPAVVPTARPTYSLGVFSMNINGAAGPDYIIQSSTNLINWRGISTNLSPVLPFVFTDSSSSGVPVQFYRVLLGP